MSGTIKGGHKAAESNKRRYGENYYKQIGKMGGLTSKGGGNWFRWLKENDPERFKEICQRGGQNGQGVQKGKRI